MNWTDINSIAISLADNHPDFDIVNVRFTDLQKMVMQLPGFNDLESRCNEKILEAIQQAWIDEAS